MKLLIFIGCGVGSALFAHALGFSDLSSWQYWVARAPIILTGAIFGVSK